MELRAYLLSDGFFGDPSVLFERPLAPGTLLVKVPVCSGMHVRLGVVVGVHDGHVDVLWNDWGKDAPYPRGELRRRFGVPAGPKKKREQRSGPAQP